MIEEIKQAGIVFVFSGPSGTGKSTLCNRILQEAKNLRFSVSCTTRQPRVGEVDGKDYHFVSRETFDERIKNHEFLEYANVYEDYYGTLKSEIESRISEGNDILLDIDVQGAMQIRKNSANHPWASAVHYIFVAPPSLEELERRLRSRATEPEEKIQRRLKQARTELSQSELYDHIVVNSEMDRALEQIRAIIRSKRKL